MENVDKFVTANLGKTPLMHQNHAIGNNVRLFRERLNLTQEQLATYLNTSRTLLNYYENGHRPMPTELITKAAKLFGVDDYDLFESDPEVSGTNIAFAFRASELLPEDFNQIANFKTIVRNYIRMRKVL